MYKTFFIFSLDKGLTYVLSMNTYCSENLYDRKCNNKERHVLYRITYYIIYTMRTMRPIFETLLIPFASASIWRAARLDV